MAMSVEQRVMHGSRRQRRLGRVLLEYGWTCQLCSERIDPKLRPRNPRGLTFDHIVPISRGGSRQSAANLWPAHRACNQAKADRLPSEA
jgi:5-methylcytosine-specific restriction endonuclease McrA